MKFVFDLDGTIVFRGQPILEPIVKALQELIEQGHEVLFASARPVRDMLPVIDERLHRCTMIGGNGSLISIDGRPAHAFAFPPHILEQIIRLLDEYQATSLIDGDWDYVYTGPPDHPILRNLDPGRLAKAVDLPSLTRVVKILVLTSSDMRRLSERLNELQVSVHDHRHEQVLDVSPRGISKWSALQYLGIEEGEYIAFGNDANDIAMFEHARHSVMVGWHERLSHLANETLALGLNIEHRIAEKMKLLGSAEE